MLNKYAFEKQVNGKQVHLFELQNAYGTKLFLTNYGARIVSLQVPTKQQKPVDVVLGYDSIDAYLHTSEVYYGATIGRYANRIADGRFSLNGEVYQLPINNAPNHLHGGPNGFHAQVWNVVAVLDNGLKCAYFSADGEAGFPGNLEMMVQFTLTNQNEVVINYTATTNKDTVLNVTNHAYFNLNGRNSGTILHHLLQINADAFTPVDETLIPTGNIQAVANTPFDFRTAMPIGSSINASDQQLQLGNGYDHNFVLNKNAAGLTHAATVTSDVTKLRMDVYTTEPGMQFYTNNAAPANTNVRGSVPETYRTAFCLETQHYPNSPNQPQFPSTTLKAGEIFNSTTVYKFSV